MNAVVKMSPYPVLMPVSVVENIAYGKPDATQHEIVRAPWQGTADGFINQLDAGYETTGKERGASLSDDQWQRIAITRAPLHINRGAWIELGVVALKVVPAEARAIANSAPVE